MEDNSRLSLVAEMIRDHISLDGIDRYLAETGVQSSDFVPVEPCEFAGEIFAVDGSNVSICNWSTANVNLIRAGYAVYRGRVWMRTVITFDDVLLADAKLCRNMFDLYLEQFFGLEGVDLKESDLDRLSSYYRELQEYVAINEALGEAHAGDIILYDGSFDVFELLRGALATIFARAEEKGVALLAVAKSSSLFWGEEITLPFVQHTGMIGSRLLPGCCLVSQPEGQKSGCGPGQMERPDLHRSLLRAVRARLPGGCAFLSPGRNGIGSGKAGRLLLLRRVPGISSCPLPGAPGYQDHRARGGSRAPEAHGAAPGEGMTPFGDQNAYAGLPRHPGDEVWILRRAHP